MDLASATGAPYTARQLINFAYVIINKTGKFQTGIRQWNHLPAAQQTWDNFTVHFTTAHRELHESGELTVTDTSFHMANLVQEVANGIQQALWPTEADEHEAEEFLHQANAAVDANMQQTVSLQQMLQMMQAIQQQMNLRPTSSDTTTRNRAFPSRTCTSTIDKYCWSHGACAHHSAACRSKKLGHQDDATFQNKKGGSTDFVPNN